MKTIRNIITVVLALMVVVLIGMNVIRHPNHVPMEEIRADLMIMRDDALAAGENPIEQKLYTIAYDDVASQRVVVNRVQENALREVVQVQIMEENTQIYMLNMYYARNDTSENFWLVGTEATPTVK